MKIVSLKEWHIAHVFSDYGVVVEVGATSADAFNQIVCSLGYSDGCNIADSIKNTAMTAYLRARENSSDVAFDLAAFALEECTKKQRAHMRSRTVLEARKKNKALQTKMLASWGVPVSREAEQPEHAGILAKLPAERFYSTKEWLQLRAEVIRNANSRCSLCGASAVQSRLHVDHIKSRIAHPEQAFTISNLRVLCEPCHRGRHLADAVSCR
jgi:hypothetical protein